MTEPVVILWPLGPDWPNADILRWADRRQSASLGGLEGAVAGEAIFIGYRRVDTADVEALEIVPDAEAAQYVGGYLKS